MVSIVSPVCKACAPYANDLKRFPSTPQLSLLSVLLIFFLRFSPKTTQTKTKQNMRQVSQNKTSEKRSFNE